ncbi:MAG: hypothetical protein GWP08_02630 [Nitrospiraceae bacterium]|nr:hypothetical protein [Nitrospiraceae bacterium]
MNSKEIVERTIERRSPPRIPINYASRDLDRSDTITLGWQPAADFVPSERGVTEWGYVWEALDETMGQPKTHPLAEWERAGDYVPPDPAAPGRLDALEDALPQWQGKFIKFSVGISGFNQAAFLRGFQTFLTDLYLAPERAERVLDIVLGFENALIARALEYPVDAFAFADDWGTQRGLMIPLDLWRAMFRPRYAEQFAAIHRAGKKVWFHSCGNVYEIINDLIEIGVDVLELLQPDLLGVERLARDFGGRVCFCCSVDHQRRAISGTREEIFAYARMLRDTLGAFDGGLILYLEDYSCLGMSRQNYQWISEAFQSLNAQPFEEESAC